MAAFIAHASIRLRGTENNYEPIQCVNKTKCRKPFYHMHCPFCVIAEVFTDPVILKAHFRVKHVDKGIDFAGLKVLRCCDTCSIIGTIKGAKKFKNAHWHCYRCRNGFNRRDEAIKHYKTHFRNPQTTFQIQLVQDIHSHRRSSEHTDEALIAPLTIDHADIAIQHVLSEATISISEHTGFIEQPLTLPHGELVAANETVVASTVINHAPPPDDMDANIDSPPQMLMINDVNGQATMLDVQDDTDNDSQSQVTEIQIMEVKEFEKMKNQLDALIDENQMLLTENVQLNATYGGSEALQTTVTQLTEENAGLRQLIADGEGRELEYKRMIEQLTSDHAIVLAQHREAESDFCDKVRQLKCKNERLLTLEGQAREDELTKQLQQSSVEQIETQLQQLKDAHEQLLASQLSALKQAFRSSLGGEVVGVIEIATCDDDGGGGPDATCVPEPQITTRRMGSRTVNVVNMGGDGLDSTGAVPPLDLITPTVTIQAYSPPRKRVKPS